VCALAYREVSLGEVKALDAEQALWLVENVRRRMANPVEPTCRAVSPPPVALAARTPAIRAGR